MSIFLPKYQVSMHMRKSMPLLPCSYCKPSSSPHACQYARQMNMLATSGERGGGGRFLQVLSLPLKAQMSGVTFHQMSTGQKAVLNTILCPRKKQLCESLRMQTAGLYRVVKGCWAPTICIANQKSLRMQPAGLYRVV